VRADFQLVLDDSSNIGCVLDVQSLPLRCRYLHPYRQRVPAYEGDRH
jgi:hypothetical protein